MACWQIAQHDATVRKINAARKYNLEVCTGGGPFEIAAHFGKIEQFLDLCASMGFTRVEAGEGFTETLLKPADVVRMANARELHWRSAVLLMTPERWICSRVSTAARRCWHRKFPCRAELLH